MIKEIKKTIYICDCCKKEFDSSDLKDGLNKCRIPMIYYFDKNKQLIKVLNFAMNAMKNLKMLSVSISINSALFGVVVVMLRMINNLQK